MTLNRFRSFFTFSFLAALIFTACFRPHRSFGSYRVPSPPDYSLEKNWAALPWTKDSADAVPVSSLEDGQANARADVFFIHPTLYYKGRSWNADVNDAKTNQLVDRYTIRMQASVFNGSCRVFAPRYRQATLASFMDGDGNGRQALDTAYNDIRRAFRYYLDHYNQGRPIVIAAHSQGSFHGARLLKEFFDNDPALRKRLVAAYLVGGAAASNMFTNIPPGDSAAQTGCYLAWHARKWGTSFEPKTQKSRNWPAYENTENYECVNPLTWRRDTAYAPASLNAGSVPRTFNRVDRGVADAKVSPGRVLWVHAPSAKGYLKGENYHVMDYGLFWMNIRENVKLRVDRFLQTAKQ